MFVILVRRLSTVMKRIAILSRPKSRGSKLTPNVSFRALTSRGQAPRGISSLVTPCYTEIPHCVRDDRAGVWDDRTGVWDDTHIPVPAKSKNIPT